MIYILHYLKNPKLWEIWSIPNIRIYTINRVSGFELLSKCSDYYFRIRTTALGFGLLCWASDYYFRVRTAPLENVDHYPRVRSTTSGFGQGFGPWSFIKDLNIQ